MRILLLLSAAVLLPALCGPVAAQTGTPSEPVRYIGGRIADPTKHDGGLPLAVGTENIQVMRANRSHPGLADDYGWTYNHAPNLTWWQGRFWLQYLSNPVHEHEHPGHTLLVNSADGRTWGKPVVAFPAYPAPVGVEIPEGYKGYMMHQRMGFYTSPDGRLLTVAFYGHTDNPFREGGIGRVVREVHPDGTMGPIYFIRYTTHRDWNASNTAFPFYKQSPDTGFVAACDALLADGLRTMQWWDEDKGLDGFYEMTDSLFRVEAFSYYRRADGKWVGLWKKSRTALSDNGTDWSVPVVAPTFIMAGGKQWGQRTPDGRYAICYNPIATQQYRYPLVAVTGPDGTLFDDMCTIHGEVPPRRFFGWCKDFGPCYMRGIEDDVTPTGSDMWLTYSVNKEDIWISRIPVPLQTAVRGDVRDDFNSMAPGGAVPDWNIYSPRWAPVSVEPFPSQADKSLSLRDSDPCDYARAIRIFETSQRATISLRVHASQSSHGQLHIEVTDGEGNRPVRIFFDSDWMVKYDDGSKQHPLSPYRHGVWYDLAITLDTSGLGYFELALNGKTMLANAQFAEAVKSVERLSLCTGPFRNKPDRNTPNQDPEDPVPAADQRSTEASFHIDNVHIIPSRKK